MILKVVNSVTNKMDIELRTFVDERSDEVVIRTIDDTSYDISSISSWDNESDNGVASLVGPLEYATTDDWSCCWTDLSQDTTESVTILVGSSSS